MFERSIARLGLCCLAACAAACHPRSDAAPDLEQRDPPCLAVTTSSLQHRVEQGRLLVDQQLERICPRPGEEASQPRRLATVTLSPESGCPAGEVALEIAASERRARPALPMPDDAADALRNFAAVHGRGSGIAFVLSCRSPARWLFVALDGLQPTVQEFSEAPPPAPVVEAEGTCEEPLPGGEQRWVGRVLSTGAMPGPSRLTRWYLGRTKDRGTLVIQELEALEKNGRANDQPHGEWRCVRSATWEGPVTGARQLELQLAQRPGGPTMSLVCRPRSTNVAAADARRVRVSRPSPGEGCNASRWSSRHKTELRVLACAEGGSDEFFLAQGPGVERVVHDEDVLYDEPGCKGPVPALRRVPPDGGVATAIRLSEAPGP